MLVDTDVLIVGAGAAGLTLAIDLARRGVDFLLIEKNAQPFGGSRGKGIQPRTLEIFEDLGVIDRIQAAGAPYPPFRHYRPAGTTEASLLPEGEDTPTPSEPYPAPIMLPQFKTEAILRERLLEWGHRPYFGQCLNGFESNADGVSSQVEDAAGIRRIKSRFLVGTDGGRSFVRHALGIGFPGETLHVRALVADVRLTGLDRRAWHRFQLGGPATQLMICPLAGTDLFQLQGPVALDGDVDLSPEALTALVAERTGRADIAVHDVSWSSVYSMNARLADHYRVGRVFLAGDAAHIHPPAGGQGLNTSVQDAYNLGWKLHAVLGGAPDALLDTYEEERRPIAADMLGLSTRLLGEMQRGTLRRDRASRQLDLGYRTSSLSLPRSHHHRIQPGDRAPDAPCTQPNGEPTRLFTLFQGPQWIVLGYPGAGAGPQDLPASVRSVAIGEHCDIVDESGHIADAYGLGTGQWALIRPDGYIAAILESDELETRLPGYLATMLRSSPTASASSLEKH